MKLSKLYSNKPKVFEAVLFGPKLNVIFGEILLPDNKAKDTHNLGKSTLGRVIDYVFLSGSHPKFFLVKHKEQFKDFIFYLEIDLGNGSFVTVRRSVVEPTKISFKKHKNKYQDYTELLEGEWDHFNVPFKRAKELLDGLLDLRAIKPWTFRNGLGYLVRSQDDYLDVFKLKKFGSKDSYWKPYLAHVLGFNAETVKEHYKIEEEKSKNEAIADTVRAELGGSIEDISKIEGILLLKQQEVDIKQQLLDSFDFREADEEKTKYLVNEIDEHIALLNSKRYTLSKNRKKIIKALEEDKILFNPDTAENIFQEAGVLFSGQIKKDFQQLIDFNKAITEERKGYLLEEKISIDEQLKSLSVELKQLGETRSGSLSFLNNSEVFEKYKQISTEQVRLRADIESLARQKGHLQRLQELRTKIRSLSEKCSHLQSEIEVDVEKHNSDKNSLFSQIRLFFSEIVDEVIDRKALLSVSPNQYGHLQFKAEILDESGNSTSADDGYTYRKLLCIAFDLAVLRAHSKEMFPHFVFHDGVFESLDNRKKENLLSVIRRYSENEVQVIITLIDSDLPDRGDEESSVFNEEEVVLRLHDDGLEGRLFKMRTW